jgi:hypothetical protein
MQQRNNAVAQRQSDATKKRRNDKAMKNDVTTNWRSDKAAMG